MSELGLKERVVARIEECPGIFSRDLADDLGVSSQAVNVAVHHLQNTGKIHRINHLGERRAKWQVGPAPDFDPENPMQGTGQPRQRVVKTWDKTPAPRDPLLWALYGAQP